MIVDPRRRARTRAQTAHHRARTSTLVAPIANKVDRPDHRATSLPRPAPPAGESSLGDLIADAQLADPSVVDAADGRRRSRS